jgi:hypothetical protein
LVKFLEILVLFFYIFWLFSYYSINTVIGIKMGYDVAGIGQNTVDLPICPFFDWAGKSGNFLDLS